MHTPAPDTTDSPLPRPRRTPRNEAERKSVPLSVWLTEPLSGCCPTCETPSEAACAHRIPTALARQIVDAFSARGDLVFLPEAGSATVLTAVIKAGRKAVAYTPGNRAADLAYETLQTDAPAVASLAVLRRGTPGLPAEADRHGGRARLAVAAPHSPATPAQLAALTETCSRALCPDGVLVICSRQTSGHDTAGHLVAHAQAAGLVYLQHIVAVEATAAEADLVPLAPSRTRHDQGCACHHPRPGSGRHALIHNDLLIFIKP